MKFSVVNIGTVGNATGATLTLTPVTVPHGATIFVCVTEKSTSGTDGTLADTVNTYSKLTSGSLAATAADGRGMLFAVTNAGALSAGTLTYTRNLSGAAAAMSAFYVAGATGAAIFTEGLASATGTTGTITVTSGSLGAGRLVLGVLFDSGSTTAGGNATFTQDSTNGAYATPPIEIKSAAGSAQARVDGGHFFKAASGTQVYAPTMSSTAQQWFLVVLGIIPAPDSAEIFDNPALGRPSAKSFDPPNLALTTLAPTVVTVNYSFRAPFFARLPDPKAKANQGEAVAASAPLYTPNPTRPFTQLDWPRALDAKARAVGEPIGRVAPLLTPNPATPFNQYEWRTTARTPLSLKSDVYWGTFALYAPNPAQPFNQLDWPRISTTQKARVDDPVNFVPLTAVVVVGNPFSQFDWPNAKPPIQKVIGEVVGTLSPLLTPPVVVTTTVFRAPLFVTIPRLPAARIDDFVNLRPLYTVVVAATPFQQNDWTGVSTARPKITDTSVAASAPLYTPNPAQPFAQNIWDSAIKGLPKVVGEVVGTLSPLLTPNPASPFNQYEWRSTARIPLSLKSDAVAGIAPLYQPNPAQPFHQDSWESPIRARPLAIGDVLAPPNPIIYPNPAQPFSQSDWTRVLAQRKATVDDVVNLNPLYGFVARTFPFNQGDWPGTARLANSDRGVAIGPNLSLGIPPAPPPSTQLHQQPFLATAGRLMHLPGNA